MDFNIPDDQDEIHDAIATEIDKRKWQRDPGNLMPGVASMSGLVEGDNPRPRGVEVIRCHTGTCRMMFKSMHDFELHVNEVHLSNEP